MSNPTAIHQYQFTKFTRITQRVSINLLTAFPYLVCGQTVKKAAKALATFTYELGDRFGQLLSLILWEMVLKVREELALLATNVSLEEIAERFELLWKCVSLCLGKALHLCPHCCMLCNKGIQQFSCLWQERPNDWKQSFFFGLKMGSEIIVKETDCIFCLVLWAIHWLLATREALSQTKGEEQAQVVLTRERCQAWVAFGHVYTSTSSTRGARSIMKLKRGWTSLPIRV